MECLKWTKRRLLTCKRCDIIDIQKIKLKTNENFFTTMHNICLSDKMPCISEILMLEGKCEKMEMC